MSDIKKEIEAATALIDAAADKANMAAAMVSVAMQTLVALGRSGAASVSLEMVLVHGHPVSPSILPPGPPHG